MLNAIIRFSLRYRPLIGVGRLGRLGYGADHTGETALVRHADIHGARKGVQERLAAVQQDLPAGIQPQMAPISSILGQIMVVGVYSQPGPRGGVLAPLGETGHWAELVYHPEEGVVSVFLWQ